MSTAIPVARCSRVPSSDYCSAAFLIESRSLHPQPRYPHRLLPGLSACHARSPGANRHVRINRPRISLVRLVARAQASASANASARASAGASAQGTALPARLKGCAHYAEYGRLAVACFNLRTCSFKADVGTGVELSHSPTAHCPLSPPSLPLPRRMGCRPRRSRNSNLWNMQ